EQNGTQTEKNSRLLLWTSEHVARRLDERADEYRKLTGPRFCAEKRNLSVRIGTPANGAAIRSLTWVTAEINLKAVCMPPARMNVRQEMIFKKFFPRKYLKYLFKKHEFTQYWKGQRPPTSSVLTFSAELALLLASAAAGRALARALVLALPASNQHFPQLPSQRLEGSVIGRENGAGVCRAAVRTAHIHKPQLARSHAGRIV
ncbi:hypothetical protein ALC60_04402, partial [Trachymyrmex zeteki]